MKVPAHVLEGIEAVKATGHTNMIDSLAVQALATRMGFQDAACWIARHPTHYVAGIIYGFEPKEK